MSVELIVHGHFYQPPRENPWTETLEREASAAPFHDWNERIHEECYRANAFARILDGFGGVERIIDNYELLSFNFGPTLLSWMERSHAETYRRIIDADQRSRAAHGGHGNAIAQAYNHPILPLLSERDRRTQIRWGLADFAHRFGRASEGMWLPETAADAATLDSLIEEDVRFTVLAPTQAERVRPLEGPRKSSPPGPAATPSRRSSRASDPAAARGAWRDVSDGSIDTSQAYRYFHRDGRGRSIDVVFYHGAVAHAVAFEGVLASSDGLLERMSRASNGPLMCLATDGETFGHHFHFGDRTIAYALGVAAERRGFHPTNFGEFLERHPPRFEVELKRGADGLGTAWSCAHGVGRWSRDCGCQTGGREGWNQAWRAPLRGAMQRLDERAAALFERQGSELFDDVWAARDAFVEVLLDRGALLRFFERFAPRAATDPAAGVRARTLLEMQRACLLAHTSCGWFFADISGLESVQVMRYAARAIDLFGELDPAGGRAAEEELLSILVGARSNLVELGTGADVWRRSVATAAVSDRRVAAHLAITGLLDPDRPKSGDAGGHHFSPCGPARRATHGRIRLSVGALRLESLATGRAREHSYAAVHLGGADFFCAVDGAAAAQTARAEALFESLERTSLPSLLRALQSFGEHEFGLEHVLAEAKEEAGQRILSGLVERFQREYDALYDDHWRTFELLRSSGFELPVELRTAAELSLGRSFDRALERAGRSLDPADYAEAERIAAAVKARRLTVDLSRARRLFSELAQEATAQAIASPSDARFARASALLELAQRLGVQPDLARPQERLYLAAMASPMTGTDREGVPVQPAGELASPMTGTERRGAELERLARLLGFAPGVFT
jgi:hypothetical protein